MPYKKIAIIIANKLTQNNTGKIVLKSISILDYETIIQMCW